MFSLCAGGTDRCPFPPMVSSWRKAAFHGATSERSPLFFRRPPLPRSWADVLPPPAVCVMGAASLPRLPLLGAFSWLDLEMETAHECVHASSHGPPKKCDGRGVYRVALPFLSSNFVGATWTQSFPFRAAGIMIEEGALSPFKAFPFSLR